MKALWIILFSFCYSMTQAQQNKPVDQVDLERFAGKWYSLSSIPTPFDAHWRETTETYTRNAKGHFEVYTTYKKKGKDKSVRSKLFVVPGTGNAEMKAQFVWPFKADYWVIELPEDYSYMVVGHPQKKFLFIMARQPFMDKVLYHQVVERCSNRGYATADLVVQFGFLKK